jgi:hypothetical protein
MGKLKPLLAHDKPKRVRTVVGRLKLIRDMADDAELRDLAIDLLDALE